MTNCVTSAAPACRARAAAITGSIAAACLAAAAAGLAAAQSYPVKSVRMIVPFSAGGGTDIVARTIALRMGESLGQSVVVDNRAGANSNIGLELAARAVPDGYTLIMTSSAMAINPSVYRKLAFDPVKDFAPVTLATLIPFVLVVHPSLPVKSVRELVTLGRARAGQLTFASSGTGNATHLSMELFKAMTGIDMVHVPYKGTGQALTDIIGGQVEALFGSIPSTMPHARSGKLRVLAMSAAKRSQAIPEVPTVAESGVPGYELTSWYGVLAPAGTPNEVVSRLHSEVIKTLAHPDVRSRLSGEGADPVGNTPAEFAAFIRSEIGKYAKVVTAAKLARE
jgi:tripartite-type tricarboxylate transporter receptor subunit TctC